MSQKGDGPPPRVWFLVGAVFLLLSRKQKKEKILENNLGCFVYCFFLVGFFVLQWLYPHLKRAYNVCSAKKARENMEDHREIREQLFRLSRAIAREEKRGAGTWKGKKVSARDRPKQIKFR